MRYKEIADHIVQDIHQQRLREGQRMPSLRKMAAQFDVSLTTALNCYRRLEQLGWVVARPQSGFYVSTPLGEGGTPVPQQFSSCAIQLKLRSEMVEGISACSGPFGVSQLGPDLLPGLELQRSLKRGLQYLGDDIRQYTQPRGLSSVRQALSVHYGEAGFALAADELVLTNGCIDAVRLALEVTTEPGDAVAISSPCFNGLLELLAGLGRQVVEIPCLSDGIDLEQLERHLRNGEVAAGLFSSSHMNPQSTCLSSSQKQALAALANRYRVPMIEDDVYGDLSYDGGALLPLKFWDTEGYVLWCSSVSKTLAAGLRLGWCLPGRYQSAYVQRSQFESLGCNSLIQQGLADFIRSGQYLKHLKRLRSHLFQQARAYRQLFVQHLPEGSAVSQPSGGMVLWVQVPDLHATRLAALCATAELDIRLGAQFSSRGLYQDCYRVNIGWALHLPHDATRTIEQAILELCQLTRAARG